MKSKLSLRLMLLLVLFFAIYLAMMNWTRFAAEAFADEMDRNSGRVATKLLADAKLPNQEFCLGVDDRKRTTIADPGFMDILLLRRNCIVRFITSRQDATNEVRFQNIAEYEVGLLSSSFKRSWQEQSR
ncbi:hypothetical protein [Aporhodopirellula aestuarii]|uniref:Uncharacterized protein n=1 Tax=Aporhodopirellula aestuarii TaxID=2950107 RepID=A0ABT0UDX9_9BACT|nr:hypothetical protein [Aporhodopirellula aestuarii]MCM2375259.1 hypothetical protein [Aporhodopirellula aestuarii]